MSAPPPQRSRRRSRFASTAPPEQSSHPPHPPHPPPNQPPAPPTPRGKLAPPRRRPRHLPPASSPAPDAPALFSHADLSDEDLHPPPRPPPRLSPPPSVLMTSSVTSPVGMSSSQFPPTQTLSEADDPLDAFMNALATAPVKSSNITAPRPPSPTEDHNSPDPLSAPAPRAKRLYERVDHAKVRYPSFERQLYIPVPELAMQSATATAAARRALSIRVRGRAIPAPVSTWAQCGLPSALLARLRLAGLEAPTPVQAQAIPAVMSGRDVIAVARTGSGKTLAFVLPLLRHVARAPRAAAGDGPGALVVAPTRELAIQIFGDAAPLARAVGLRAVCAYGGSAVKDQIAELKRGADLVVCTPGRIIDLLAMNSGKITNLRRVTFVVLDEADRMFDMGFEPQLTRIVENVRPDRQTVMFSATFPAPVERLARRILLQPVEITVGGNSVAPTTIKQHIEVRTEESKFFRLLELLGRFYESGSTLVFVDRQENADRIFRELCRARYKCLPLHGGMDQADRDSTIADFKNGVVKVLVATSVAARGLDVRGLTLVVNYDAPTHYEDYVHRVGRTGRAGRSGTAFTFVTREQESVAPDLVRALQRSARVAAEADAPDGDKEMAKKLGDEAATAAVPSELRELADGFQLKRKAGIVKYGPGSGYGGRGINFEENEKFDAARKALRKMQAKQFAAENGLVEDEVGMGIKDEEEGAEEGSGEDSDDGIVPVRTGLKASAPALDSGKASNGSNPKTMGVNGHTSLSDRDISKLLEEAVRNAGASADALKVNEEQRRTLIAKAKAKVLSMVSGPELNGSRGPTEEDGEEEDVRASGSGSASRYAGEVEINDYPQHARWQVTRKGSLTDVEEFTSCVVTTRGNFYAAGRNPPAGKRKLHLLIEGPSRRSVKIAKRDIQQKLDEAASVTRPGESQYSKYSVV